jgi:cytochrome c peroxidase
MKHAKILVPAAILMASVWILAGCQSETAVKKTAPSLPSQPYTYLTSAYNAAAGSGGDNSQGRGGGPITLNNNYLNDHGATLGRVLFYDARLSVNNSVSCGSCHKQQLAFADDKALSEGFGGMKTGRNTPAIINEMNRATFFWDGRTNSLETQTLMPVKNHIEMGFEKTDVLTQKLAAVSFYPALFQNAFGTTEVTTERISMALSQFIRSIASARANVSASSQAAIDGEKLFFSKYNCGACHTGSNLGGSPLFQPYYPIGSNSRISNVSNIGLDENYTDQGVQALTGDKTQNGFFVIPSLRNVALTAPYMHDGRFASLSEVIDHYSQGVKAHPNLDPQLLQENFDAKKIKVQTGTPVRMNISKDDKSKLIAFLIAQTDASILTDPKFSNPFK